MRLRSLVITFIQVAVVESIREVFGYHGDSVILPSGANSSWTLTKIEWSIYTNNTWIATYQKKKINVDRLYSYKGRLHLNTSTGDLTIRELKAADAMEYSVDLIDDKGHISSNKIRLIVRKQLQQPTIQIVNSNSAIGDCWVILNCSSADEGVHLTWHSENSDVTSGSDGSSAVLSVLANTTQKLTCNSRKGNETASAHHTLQCEGSIPDPPPGSRIRIWLVFFTGVSLGILVTLAVIYREKIQNTCAEAKKKVCPKDPNASVV